MVLPSTAVPKDGMDLSSFSVLHPVLNPFLFFFFAYNALVVMLGPVEFLVRAAEEIPPSQNFPSPPAFFDYSRPSGPSLLES